MFQSTNSKKDPLKILILLRTKNFKKLLKNGIKMTYPEINTNAKRNIS